MKIIEVSDSKIGKLTDGIGEMLMIGENLMQCLEDLKGGYGMRESSFGARDGGYGMRESGYGMREGGYGNRMDFPERDDDGYPIMSRYGERGRRRNRLGQFV